MSAPSVLVDFENLDELKNELEQLERKLQLKVLRKASRSGAKVVQADAIRYAPVDEGDLAKTIKVRSAKKSSGARLPRGMFGHSVGVDRKQFPGSFYATFQFLGTKYIEATETLREALYANEKPIEAAYIKELKRGVKEVARESEAR